ncbi:MAG TPA: DUF721 domain-containing protein [Candidatus Latescibacteria bacterium]|nr:DUF721 domain-containing protein [Candidatus Handelsmanbacteria bacterium]HIL11526.1 DUF721 domain-containing protein [Candidatus Latescibacterota bacterium]
MNSNKSSRRRPKSPTPARNPVSSRSTSKSDERSLGSPTLLDGLLESVIAELGAEQKLAECRARIVWEEAVGSALAQHARPLRVRRGQLEIAVPSAVWRTQLSFMQRDIIARINQLLGSEVVKGLRLMNQTESEDV